MICGQNSGSEQRVGVLDADERVARAGGVELQRQQRVRDGSVGGRPGEHAAAQWAEGHDRILLEVDRVGGLVDHPAVLHHGRAELLRGLEREGVMVLDTVPERLTVDAVNRYLALKTGVRT